MTLDPANEAEIPEEDDIEGDDLDEAMLANIIEPETDVNEVVGFGLIEEGDEKDDEEDGDEEDLDPEEDAEDVDYDTFDDVDEM